jgi:hypothetical protein
MEQAVLLDSGESAEVIEARRAAKRAAWTTAANLANPRVVGADRSQIELRPQDLESLIPLGHRARVIWSFVERLDLSRFYEPIRARGSRRSCSPSGCTRTAKESAVRMWSTICAAATVPTAGSAAA